SISSTFMRVRIHSSSGFADPGGDPVGRVGPSACRFRFSPGPLVLTAPSGTAGFLSNRKRSVDQDSGRDAVARGRRRGGTHKKSNTWLDGTAPPNTGTRLAPSIVKTKTSHRGCGHEASWI